MYRGINRNKQQSSKWKKASNELLKFNKSTWNVTHILQSMYLFSSSLFISFWSFVHSMFLRPFFFLFSFSLTKLNSELCVSVVFIYFFPFSSTSKISMQTIDFFLWNKNCINQIVWSIWFVFYFVWYHSISATLHRLRQNKGKNWFLWENKGFFFFSDFSGEIKTGKMRSEKWTHTEI